MRTHYTYTDRRTGRDTPVRTILRLINRDAFPASVRALATDLSSWEAWRLLRRLDLDTAASIFPHFDARAQQVIAENVDPDWLAAMLTRCSPAERSRCLRRLSPEQRRLLERVEPLGTTVPVDEPT